MVVDSNFVKLHSVAFCGNPDEQLVGNSYTIFGDPE